MPLARCSFVTPAEATVFVDNSRNGLKKNVCGRACLDVIKVIMRQRAGHQAELQARWRDHSVYAKYSCKCTHTASSQLVKYIFTLSLLKALFEKVAGHPVLTKTNTFLYANIQQMWPLRLNFHL